MTGQQDLLAPVSLAMLTDTRALAEAARLARARDLAAVLRARRYLDQIRAAEAGHPSPQVSYRHAIAHLEQHARPEEARLLGDLAQLEPVLADAAQQWQDRYAHRAATTAEQDDRRAAVTADWAVRDGPCAGIDGMLYTPGLCLSWGQDVPLVLAQGRGTLELITGFPCLDAARSWVRDDRCTADPGPLIPPPGIRPPRITQEEHVLAGLLRHPAQLGEVVTWLPATTFTADVRYDIFAAIAAARHAPPDAITRAFGVPGIDQITQETLTRLARGPDWDNPRLGGPGTPLATAYLHRLASTPITAGTAAQAVRRLATADAHALLDAQAQAAVTPRPATPPPAPRRVPAALPVQPLTVHYGDLPPHSRMPVQPSGPAPSV